MKDEKVILIKELQDELFQKNGEGWFRIISGSMSPLIEGNDKVLVKKVNSFEIEAKDIILFKVDDVFVTHRVANFSRNDGKTMILQKGDASNHASLIPSETIIGKVKGIEKKGRFLDLDSWQGRVMNFFFGWKNCFFYRFCSTIDPVKQWLRDKPGFALARALYRNLKKLFEYIHRMMIRIVFLPVFFK